MDNHKTICSTTFNFQFHNKVKEIICDKILGKENKKIYLMKKNSEWIPSKCQIKNRIIQRSNQNIRQ